MSQHDESQKNYAESSQTPEVTYGGFHFYSLSRIGRLGGAEGRSVLVRRAGVIPDDPGLLFEVGCVLNVGRGDSCTTWYNL